MNRESRSGALPTPATFPAARSDMIAFVDPAADVEPASKIRRFGDEPHHASLFEDLARVYAALENTKFAAEMDVEILGLVGRASQLQPAHRLSGRLGGGQIYMKREDMAGPDRHLLLSIAAQGLVARKLGRKTLVTGTVDGRRGVVTAQVAAKLGLKSIVFMDQRKTEQHSGNVFRMKLLGADLRVVDARSLRNGDVREAALLIWAMKREEVFLVTGLDATPPPYPMLLRNAISSIGRECRRQMLAVARELPAAVLARNGKTADALGVFPTFLAEPCVDLVCVEASPPPPPERGASSRLTAAESRTANAIMQGLEYPSVRREHQWLKSTGRVRYLEVSQADTMKAIKDFSEQEGFIPPYETAQVLACACAVAATLNPAQTVVAVIAEQAKQDIWDIGRLMGVSL